MMRLEVEHQDLWDRFRSCERNEMIITKNGRCMFPLLKFKIREGFKCDDENSNNSKIDIINNNNNDLHPGDQDLFSYALSMERVDYNKWKFRHDRWFCLQPSLPAQNVIKLQERETFHLFEPESSPKPWNQLKSEGINFSKVKLTNRKSTTTSASASLGNVHFKTYSDSKALPDREEENEIYFSLSSFSNYVPVVHLVDWELFLSLHADINSVPIGMKRLFELYPMKILEEEGSLRRFKMDECAFIAVTHYQNDLITHLKKHNNPHAKGFILSNDGIGKILNSVPRGRPGRKKRTHVSIDNLCDKVENAVAEFDKTVAVNTLSEEVILAGLALEKMSGGKGKDDRSFSHTEFIASTPNHINNQVYVPRSENENIILSTDRQEVEERNWENDDAVFIKPKRVILKENYALLEYLNNK